MNDDYRLPQPADPAWFVELSRAFADGEITAEDAVVKLREAVDDGKCDYLAPGLLGKTA